MESEGLPPARLLVYTHHHWDHTWGACAELEHVGGRHTPESTIVRIPRDGVIFLGDCYYPPPYHLRGPEDGLDLDLLKSIVSNDYEWYVESHAPPWRRADIG